MAPRNSTKGKKRKRPRTDDASSASSASDHEDESSVAETNTASTPAPEVSSESKRAFNKRYGVGVKSNEEILSTCRYDYSRLNIQLM